MSLTKNILKRMQVHAQQLLSNSNYQLVWQSINLWQNPEEDLPTSVKLAHYAIDVKPAISEQTITAIICFIECGFMLQQKLLTSPDKNLIQAISLCQNILPNLIIGQLPISLKEKQNLQFYFNLNLQYIANDSDDNLKPRREFYTHLTLKLANNKNKSESKIILINQLFCDLDNLINQEELNEVQQKQMDSIQQEIEHFLNDQHLPLAYQDFMSRIIEGINAY